MTVRLFRYSDEECSANHLIQSLTHHDSRETKLRIVFLIKCHSSLSFTWKWYYTSTQLFDYHNSWSSMTIQTRESYCYHIMADIACIYYLKYYWRNLMSMDCHPSFFRYTEQSMPTAHFSDVLRQRNSMCSSSCDILQMWFVCLNIALVP